MLLTAPEREVVQDLLSAQPYALPGEPQPYGRRREGVHGADTVEVVDGHSVLGHVVVPGIGGGQLRDALTD